MRVLQISPTDIPNDVFLGAYLKSAFDQAVREGYDAVMHWRNPRQDSRRLADALLQALIDHPEAAGAYVVSDTIRGWRTWTGRAWSRFMRVISGHSQRTWWSLGHIYRTEALSRIAYELNTYESHFETEVVLQLLAQRAILIEVPGAPQERRRPARPSAHEMFQSFKAALKYRLQKVNLFYDFRYHPEKVLGLPAHTAAAPYRHKFAADSPHEIMFRDPSMIPHGTSVLDIGCASGYVARRLVKDRQCQVVGVDCLEPEAVEATGFEYHSIDLEKNPERLMALVRERSFDTILLLDVIEHLAVPEMFLLQLYRNLGDRPTRVIVSTANVAFFVVRLMLLLGFFNYGNKGILDITHKRLFSVRTFRNLLHQTGFMISRRVFFPMPFQELGLPPAVCRWCERFHRWLLRLRPSLFAYQILLVTYSTKRMNPSTTSVRHDDDPSHKNEMLYRYSADPATPLHRPLEL